MLTQHVKKRFFGRIVAALKVVRERPRCGEGERECGLSENLSQRLIVGMLCFNRPGATSPRSLKNTCHSREGADDW
jgi:hypothetical protein